MSEPLFVFADVAGEHLLLLTGSFSMIENVNDDLEANRLDSVAGLNMALIRTRFLRDTRHVFVVPMNVEVAKRLARFADYEARDWRE